MDYNYVSGDGREITLDPHELVGIADTIQAKKAALKNIKISWGKPAEICLAVMDKRCPWCSKRRSDGFQLYPEGAWCDCGYSH